MDQRPKVIKLLEENIGWKLHDTGLDNDFLDMTTKVQVTKEKIDKPEFKKIVIICISKGNIHMIKRQPTEKDQRTYGHQGGKTAVVWG